MYNFRKLFNIHIEVQLYNANSENKCKQLLTLSFVSILIFLIRYLSVEISRLTTVSIYSGRLPVVMKNGLQLSALVLSLVRFKVDEYCQAWTRLTIPRKQITIWQFDIWDKSDKVQTEWIQIWHISSILMKKRQNTKQRRQDKKNGNIQNDDS